MEEMIFMPFQKNSKPVLHSSGFQIKTWGIFINIPQFMRNGSRIKNVRSEEPTVAHRKKYWASTNR